MMRSRPVPHPPTQGSLMQSSFFRGAIAGVVALAALVSCTDSPVGPDTRAATDTHFLHVTYDFPKLASTQASFWAVKGKTSGVDLWYHARAGAVDSARFISLRLGTGSLDRRPDGSAIAVGDSVLITVTVTDPTHMVIDYQPAGLRFADADQPLLTMYWTACGDDLNYDGKVDAADSALVSQLNIWRQETSTDPWYKQPSVVDRTARQVTSPLGGFSGYAIMF